MAEYYPLISRAVSNMGPSTPEQRRALYERATNALLGQLRASDPPLPEADIDRERVALEDAIRRVETEASGGVDRAMFEEVLEQARQATTLPPWPSAPLPPQSQPPRSIRPAPIPVEDDHLPDRLPPGEPPGFGDLPPDEPERLRYSYAESTGTGSGPERPRPPGPRRERQNRHWLRGAIIGLAIAAVVGTTALIALKLKHNQADFSPRAPVTASGDQEAKFQERLPGGESATPTIDPAPPQPQPVVVPRAAPGTAIQVPANPPASAPVQPTPSPSPSPAPAPAPAPAAAPGPSQPAIGVLQRAILVEEPPEGTTEIKATNGRVLWRLDSVSGGSGDPLDAAVRASIEVVDVGLKADILLRRNRDAALPASHTIETKFQAGDKSANGAIRDVGVPEMRQEESTRGIPLAGISVPVTENLFLTGLSSLQGDVQRNIDLLRSRNWIMLPLRYSNGRRAILLIEKGTTGQRALTDALQAWQQG